MVYIHIPLANLHLEGRIVDVHMSILWSFCKSQGLKASFTFPIGESMGIVSVMIVPYDDPPIRQTFYFCQGSKIKPLPSVPGSGSRSLMFTIRTQHYLVAVEVVIAT